MAGAATARGTVGAVLAGGAGRRLGGDKAVVALEGRALIHYPLEALHEVCDDVAVVAKRGTLLPSLAGLAALWIEPDEPRHPLCGVVHALRRAGGRAVLVLATDLPLVDGALLRALLTADAEAGAEVTVVMPRAHGRLEPFCALYRPAALAALEGFDVDGRATAIVAERLVVCEVAPAAPDMLLNVNRPEDLLRAAAALSGGC